MNASRPHAGHALILALVLLVAFLGWRAMAVLDRPAPMLPAFIPPPVADRDVLGASDPFFGAAMTSGELLPVTSLPFSLHGVRTDAATGQGSAIIAAGDGEQQVRLIGDELGNGVTLAAIHVDHVILDASGTREALWLDASGAQRVERYDPTAYEEMPIPANNDPDVMPPSDVPNPPPPSMVEIPADVPQEP